MRCLVEVKSKKDVVYSCELTLPSKEVAKEWCKKWMLVNKKNADDHKIIVTEILDNRV